MSIACFCALVWLASASRAQVQPDLPLSHLNVRASDPLYTTYAAPLAHSEYLVDAAYHLDFYTPSRPVTYASENFGSMSVTWRHGKRAVNSTAQYARAPAIQLSYTDSVQLAYWPLAEIEVRETFIVYSSRLSILALDVVNHSSQPQQVSAALHFQVPQGTPRRIDGAALAFTQRIDPKTWSESPPPEFDPEFLNILLISAGARGATLQFDLPPNGRLQRRVVHGVAPRQEDEALLLRSARTLLTQPLEPLLRESERQYARIPQIRFPTRELELAYWSAFNLVRQQMMPPEHDAHFNYYLFSREPTWSWGHDGQVFHESLVMLAYALMDPQSAQDSQRVFMERQHQDGYIGYRLGPYAERTFPLNGENTTSAPFFNWENWEIYQLSRDRKFLSDAYASGTRFAEYILRTREKDHDGFLVWGGNAMLENVRDERDVIWNLLGGKDDSPSRVKALDLTSMMAMEMRSLAKMAQELGRADEAKNWNARAERLGALVRERMWDAESGFFYHLARDSGAFVTKDGVDLRRKEIIGFLPLWAGIATREQAEKLRAHAADPHSFHRRFGLPTLAAGDPYYDPVLKRCCQWNGAVWLPWNYLVMRGLLEYGYRKEAEDLVERALAGVIEQLRANHRFWESYSPDNAELKSPKNYVWDGIVARMLYDLYRE